ncbi:Ref family protein [Lysobacter sp. 5GHs7-4]|uniref:Ref family recombination enhancement nuclease n=1 Tax=Lysobacter sp. 5GHs7-4 TaxID=2904253 RepID=UPI001E47C0E1|nr:Ref family recombination enhancement nuclease [Lysobacter sp. 5GHs7-4]UHQ21911.1 Ref family protein [Lysobacter sp. 5GHs7-4]
MKRGRSTGNPTKAQVARWDFIREIGCVCCRINGIVRLPEIHHMTVGGKHGQKRLGHDFTFGLCAWHHRGVNAWGREGCGRFAYGPSFALEPTAFRKIFGTQEELLEFQNLLLAGFEKVRTTGRAA